MIRIKLRSAKIVGIMPSTPFSVTNKHLSTVGFHVERSYERIKPGVTKFFKIGPFTCTAAITEPR